LSDQLEEATERRNNSENKCSNMEKEHVGLVSQVENLMSSKQIIQKTMTEEIISIKNQLNSIK